MPSEPDINDWGYRLINSGNFKAAVGILKLNTILYPNSWNVFDSYGEALAKAGNKPEAIRMYRRSVELNPNNDNGKKAIEDLQRK
jgi:Flp pilus assembly protein TadD